MKKKVLPIVLALIMVLGFVPALATPTQAAATSWQDAYADVLNSPQGFYKTYNTEDQSDYNKHKPYFYFSLRDIDKNGIPELIVRWDMGIAGHACEVYTYSNGIKDLGSIGIKGEFSVSNNPEFPGLIYCSYAYNGSETYGYATIKNNELTDEVIFQTDKGLITKNNATLVAEMKKAQPILTYSISDENITNVIYNYDKTTTSKPPVFNSIKASNVARLAGADRYKTAVAISQSGWIQSDNVILADGNNYPDALVGSSYAYLKNAPILTTPSDKLNSDISVEIARLGVKTVYILGNKTSISQGVEDELSQKYAVVRIGGTDIFDTAVKVGEEIRKTNKFDTVALAAQSGFADALALAPFSARNTMPLLFSGKDSLRPDTLQALKDWNIKNVVIVGGTGVVSSAVEDSLKSMGITVTRLAGQDRYATALEIIKHFAPSEGYKSISICAGENFPDALTGAALAAKNNTPLVLVSKDSASDAMAQYINKNTLDKSYIFGGTGAVSDKVIGK